LNNVTGPSNARSAIRASTTSREERSRHLRAERGAPRGTVDAWLLEIMPGGHDEILDCEMKGVTAIEGVLTKIQGLLQDIPTSPSHLVGGGGSVAR